MDENKRRGTKSKQRVVATIFGIQKMVLFVWVCIVFMNLFICSLWLSQLPSAERLHFINTAWHSQESILKTYAHSILIWGFFWKKRINKARQQNMPTSILCRSNWDPYSPIVSKTCISGVILTQATTASASQSTNSTILLIFIAAAFTISPVLQNSYN